MEDLTSPPAKLEVCGVRLEARFVGPSPEDAPTLVFLHGGLACAESWRDFPDALARATGCGALVVSRLGHGHSDPGPSRWPVGFMHDEAEHWLTAVLRVAGVSAPVLVGHSDGASIALLHASRSATVRGLVLLAPHVFVEDVTVASIARLTEEPARASFLARLRRYHGAHTETLFAAWSDVWLSSAFRAWNIEAAVSLVTAPLLVIQGDADEYGTLAQVERVRARARVPVEARVLPGCGHVPQRDRALDTLTALTAFVSAALRPTP